MEHETPASVFRRRVGLGVLLISSGAALWLLTPAIPVLRAPSADAKTVEAGKLLFEHRWQPNDELARGDGLGPVYNAESCAACHFQGGVGGAGQNRQNVKNYVVHPTIRDRTVGGGVVHAFAVNAEFLENEKVITTLHPIVPGGVRVRENCSFKFEDFDPVRYQSINSPALFGAGWIDRISKKAIWQNSMRGMADSASREFNLQFEGVRAGRARRLADGRIGRFGWKAQFATLKEFVAAACAVEIGLGNPLQPQAQPLSNHTSVYEDSKPDLDRKQFAALVAFVDTLPKPVRTIPGDPHGKARVESGEKVFTSVGCNQCHVANLGGVDGMYSDLLLHKIIDDQEGGAYRGADVPEVPWPDSQPDPDEWRTPPLWGVADSAPYFHDGASPTLESAILRHSGSAKSVTKRFKELPLEDRAALLAFLKSLTAPPMPPVATEGTQLARAK